MHDSSYTRMEALLEKHVGHLQCPFVLDVGSRCIRHAKTYSSLMPRDWIYIGVDMAEGDNVNLVMPTLYEIPAEEGIFDIIISGQCLEHVPNPFRLIREAARVLKLGGWMILIAPWRWRVHRYLVDCWRVLPDGMEELFRDAGLEMVETGILCNDCFGVARKEKK